MQIFFHKYALRGLLKARIWSFFALLTCDLRLLRKKICTRAKFLLLLQRQKQVKL